MKRLSSSLGVLALLFALVWLARVWFAGADSEWEAIGRVANPSHPPHPPHPPGVDDPPAEAEETRREVLREALAEVEESSKPQLPVPSANNKAAVDKEPLTCILRGTLFGPDGAPAPTERGHVVALNRDGVRHASGVDQGAYALEGLIPGRWWVTGTSGESEVELEITVLPNQAEYLLDLTLPPAWIIDLFLSVEDGGAFRPASVPRELANSLAIVATPKAPGEWLAGEGIVRVRPPFRVVVERPWGRLMLGERDSVFVSLVLHEAVLATQRLERGEGEARFVVPGDLARSVSAKLRFRLVDEFSGEPLPGVTCLIRAGESMHVQPTDERGTVVLAHCAPGLVELQLTHQSYHDAHHEVRLSRGEEVDLGDLYMGRGPAFAGRILGDPPFDRVGIRSGPYDPKTGRIEFDPTVSRSVDAAGRFELSLTEGTWGVAAIDRSSAAPRGSFPVILDVVGEVPSDVFGEAARRIELELLPAVRVVVQAPRDEWAGVPFAIVDEAGVEHAGGVLAQSPHSENLPQGDFVFRAIGPDGWLELPFRAEGVFVNVPIE